MNVAECHITYVVGVFIEHRTGNERTIRQSCINGPHRYERILEMLAYEHAYVQIPLDGLERNLAVCATCWVEIQEYPKVFVSEIDFKFASCANRRAHAGKGVDELITVRDVKRLQHWPYVVLSSLTMYTADHFLLRDIEFTVAGNGHIYVTIRKFHCDIVEPQYAVSRRDAFCHDVACLQIQDVGFYERQPEWCDVWDVQFYRFV